MGDSLRTLKGVGDKTEKLFQKIGISDTEISFTIIQEIMTTFEDAGRYCRTGRGDGKSRRRCGMFLAVNGTSASGRQNPCPADDHKGCLGTKAGRCMWCGIICRIYETALKRGSPAWYFRGRTRHDESTSHLEMEHPAVYDSSRIRRHTAQCTAASVSGCAGGLTNNTAY